jgi:serine/threonine protein kinase
MGLTSGTKLEPYEITGAIGAGGMGEVYRARDTRLGRDVALKVLPQAFARDAERVARFRREAQVLASLNHPNIAAIYGFEDSGGVHALVMELVEGPTLAERIAKGPIAVEEALPIAKQLCEALEYAHERGIVHRDLKPANIKLASNDAVKILDFGLAKALQGDAASGDISSSPTITRMATQAGIILGTAAYMSPEQAKGKSVDRRADIWAFGCVLFEMLTGKMAFSGETVTDTLAAVIRAEPDWFLLPADTPQAIRQLLRRCLKKDAKQRLQSVGDARIAVEEVLSGASPEAASVSAEGRESRLRNQWSRALPWAATALLTIVAALLAIGYLWRAPQPAPVIVSQILPPPNQSFALGGNSAGPPVLSPDGRKLAFAAMGSDGKQQLWVRSLDSSAAQPLAETDGAMYPFWSPDGGSLGFFADGKLKRIDASGGPPLTLCDAPNGRGGAWNASGTILFTPDLTATVYRVPAAGGTPTEVVKPSLNTGSNRWPQFLPDGKHFLFYDHSATDTREDSGTFVGSLDGSRPNS